MSPTAASMYINLFGAVSSLVSMWAMTVTFRTLKDRLQDYKIGMKFAALQLTIVVVNIQGSVFQILARYNIPECVRVLSSTVRAYSKLNKDMYHVGLHVVNFTCYFYLIVLWSILSHQMYIFQSYDY